MPATPGVTPVQNNTAAALQIGNQQIPPEGPKAIPYSFDFSKAASYGIDINFLYQQKIITVVQVFYCDNSQNTSSVTVIASQTSQRIIVPAGAEGYYPILCPFGGTITVSSGGTAVVPFYLINVPISAVQWTPSPTGFSFDVTGSLKTADQNLAALIQNLGGGNALDVNVVHSVGAGGGGLVNTYTNINNAVGGTSTLLTATSAKIWTVDSIYIAVYSEAFVTPSSASFWHIEDSASNRIYSGSIFLPSALPTSGQDVVLLNVTGLNLALGTGIGLAFVLETSVSGTFGYSVTVAANLT